MYAARAGTAAWPLLEGYTLHRAAFTEAEQRQLLTALRSLSVETGGETAGHPVQAVRPVSTVGAGLAAGGAVPLGQRRQDDARFGVVRDAILSRRELSFLYLSASGPTARRRVRPARLVFKGQSWYLQALCLERRDYRTFKLTRMLELEDGEPFDQVLSPPPMENGWTGDAPVCRCACASPPPLPIGCTTSSTRAVSPGGRTGLWR